MILRGLLCLAAIILTVYFMKVSQNRPVQKITMSIPFLLIVIFAIYPPASTLVAQTLGVGRGVDFVLYLSSFVLLVLTFTLYLNQRLLREQVLQLTRHNALQETLVQKSMSSGDKISHVESKRSSNTSSVDTLREKTWVLIPVYNESTHVIPVIESLVDAQYSIILVNDGSQDDTADVLHHLQTTHTHYPIHVITHPINLGQGAALQTGFTYLQKYIQHQHQVDYVVTFDADGQHRVEDIEHLINALEQSQHTEIALGSRFLGSAVNMPWHRHVLLKMAVIFTRYVGGVEVSDSHNGFRALRISVLKRLHLTQARMAHASEFLHLLKHLNIKYTEVPVTIKYTEHSLSKGQSTLAAVNILFDLLIKRIFGI